MKRDVLFMLAFLAMGAALAVATPEKSAPAYVPEQAQASAMAVPDPAAPQPVSILVIVKCGRIIAMAISDTNGDLHPVNLDGMSDVTVKALVEKVPKRLVANVGCKSDIAEQSSIL